MAKRTDIHRPAEIVPEDYQYVSVECVRIEGLGDVQFQLHCREVISAHMARTGGTYSHHAHGGNCMVCGNAQAIYTVLFYHAKSNTYVRMGEQCADQVDGLRFSRNDMACLRRSVSDARDHAAGKAKAEAVLSDEGLSAAWAIFTGEPVDRWEENTIRDIVSKLVRYGSISEKQVAFLRSLVAKIPQRAALDAQRAAERAAAPAWVAGRQEFTGVVLTVKTVDSDFGATTKVMLKAEDGRRLYCTLPLAACGAQRGDTLTVKVAAEPARDDATMAFGKRPTLVRHLSVEEVAA